MLLSLYNRSSHANLLKTDETDEVFNVTENKTNSITDIFFWKYYLDLGLLQLYPWEIFSENFRDPLEHKSKVSQKSCCNYLCHVNVLKELVDGTLERDFTKPTNASVWV